jgi:hypothetical protein
MQCRGDNEGRVRVSAQQSILTWEFRCAKKYRLYRLQRPQAKKSIKKHAVVKVDDFYANKKPSTAHTKTDTGVFPMSVFLSVLSRVREQQIQFFKDSGRREY